VYPVWFVLIVTLAVLLLHEGDPNVITPEVVPLGTVPNVIFTVPVPDGVLVVFPATSYITAYALYVPDVKPVYVFVFVTADVVAVHVSSALVYVLAVDFL